MLFFKIKPKDINVLESNHMLLDPFSLKICDYNTNTLTHSILYGWVEWFSLRGTLLKNFNG